MKLLTSFRLLVRASRNLDRIANALEGLLEVQCKVHGVTATIRLPPTPGGDGDPDDDEISVSYSTDADTQREQQRQAGRARKGYARDDGALY